MEPRLDVPGARQVFVPGTKCANLTGGTANSDGAIQMGVTLRVEDRSGATSTSSQQTGLLHTRGFCGY